MERVRIQIKRLRPGSLSLPLPEYMTKGAAGMDLYADIALPVSIAPMQRLIIPTGVAIALPPDFEAQIRPRSGLALKQGITMVNSPGTIDSDYRGEIQVIAINFGHGTGYHRARPTHCADGRAARRQSRVAGSRRTSFLRTAGGWVWAYGRTEFKVQGVRFKVRTRISSVRHSTLNFSPGVLRTRKR